MVFGLAHWHPDGFIEHRFFVMQCWDKVTLHAIITVEVETGSILYSEEWPAYGRIQVHGYEHCAVNHNVNFVDPITGTYTQLIERLWVDLKLKVLEKMHGTTPGTSLRPEGRVSTCQLECLRSIFRH